MLGAGLSGKGNRFKVGNPGRDELLLSWLTPAVCGVNGFLSLGPDLVNGERMQFIFPRLVYLGQVPNC